MFFCSGLCSHFDVEEPLASCNICTKLSATIGLCQSTCLQKIRGHALSLCRRRCILGSCMQTKLTIDAVSLSCQESQCLSPLQGHCQVQQRPSGSSANLRSRLHCHHSNYQHQRDCDIKSPHTPTWGHVVQCKTLRSMHSPCITLGEYIREGGLERSGNGLGLGKSTWRSWVTMPVCPATTASPRAVSPLLFTSFRTAFPPCCRRRVTIWSYPFLHLNIVWEPQDLLCGRVFQSVAECCKGCMIELPCKTPLQPHCFCIK